VTKEIKKIRVFFPLLLRKDGKPRVRQKPVIVSLNGRTVYILRGFMSEVPQWVQDVCDCAIVSNIKFGEEKSDCQEYKDSLLK